MADAINKSPATWTSSKWGTLPKQLTGSAVDKTKYGHVIESQIMVFKDPKNCSSTKMNGHYDIDGYATAVVYDAVATGAASKRKIAMRIVCETTSAKAGGSFYGTKVPPQFQ